VGWWSLAEGEAPAPVLPTLKRKAAASRPANVAGGAPAPQYIKLRRNEWAPGLKAPRVLAHDESSVCQCPPLADAEPAAAAASSRVGCGRDCLNRSMNTFCDPRTCPSGAACSNRPFHLLAPPRSRAFLTSNGRGWGLAAAEAIRAGSFVVEYMGEVLDDAMCEQRLWADKARGETNFYMMEVNRNQVIDARHKGNTARLINSSCRPNCETQRWVDGSTGETRVGIFAVRDVEVGEELTCAPAGGACLLAHVPPNPSARLQVRLLVRSRLNSLASIPPLTRSSLCLSFTHFGGDSATSFRCVCGAPDCRGTLDANPQRGLNRGRRIEVLWDDGVFYPATVAAYIAGSGKFRLVYDDGDTETVRLEADPTKRVEGDVEWRWLEGEAAVAGEPQALLPPAAPEEGAHAEETHAPAPPA